MKSPEERIIDDFVKIDHSLVYFIDIRPDSRIFRDKLTGKMYEIKVREVKEKVKKSK